MCCEAYVMADVYVAYHVGFCLFEVGSSCQVSAKLGPLGGIENLQNWHFCFEHGFALLVCLSPRVTIQLNTH
jgi:hypothetical protein